MSRKLVGTYKVLKYNYMNGARMTIPSEVLELWGKVPEKVLVYVDLDTKEMIVRCPNEEV